MNNIIELLSYVEHMRSMTVDKYSPDDTLMDKMFFLGRYTAYNNVAYEIKFMIENEIKSMVEEQNKKVTPFDVSRETLKDDLMKTNNPYME